MQQVKNILVLQKMLSRVPGEVLSRVCLIHNESSGGWKSQEATPRHTHTHTHTHLFYVQLSSLTNCEQGATKPLAHCFAREITRLHFFIPNCGVWLECCFRETHLHIKSRLTFPSTSLNSSSLRRGCTSFFELNLPSMSIEINKSTQWLSRAGHLPLTQHCAGVFTPFSDACL